MQKKKQHYVPQLHLERFTFDGERLYVYDKFNKKFYVANKRDVAEENFFYNIPAELITQEFADRGIYPQIYEDLLSTMEGKHKKAINDLLKMRADRILNGDLRILLAYFLAVQILRTRDSRNLIIQLQTKFMQSLADEVIKLNFPDDTDLTPIVKMKHEVIAHLKVILNPEFVGPISDMLSKHIWLIGLNETGHPLYTSDTPIVKRHYVEHKYMTGWEGPGVEIVYPVSPNHALILLDRIYFENYEEHDGLWVGITEAQVEYFNTLQAIHSYRQVYSSTNNFDLVEKICQEQPEVCSPDDKRVEVNTYDKESDELGKIKKDVEVLVKSRSYRPAS
jgi:hypothetical protein